MNAKDESDFLVIMAMGEAILAISEQVGEDTGMTALCYAMARILCNSTSDADRLNEGFAIVDRQIREIAKMILDGKIPRVKMRPPPETTH